MFATAMTDRTPDTARVDYKPTAYVNGYEFTQGSGYGLPTYPFVPPPELATEHKRGEADIVIVGAGLSGLTLACTLAQLGVRAVLLDEDDTVGVKGASSRGICYTQKSLEIFNRLGIYERIAQRGIQWSVGRTFAGTDEVYSFNLADQAHFHLSAQPPFINIQQFYVEGFLVERVAELNALQPAPVVDLRWRNRVTGFEQSADCATLQISTPAGDYSLQARHVIDATGASSPIRKWLDVGVTAKRGDDRWCIADVRFSTQPPIERHTWIEAPFNENRAVWQHLMADGVWRIDYQMAPDADPAYVSREDVVRERLTRQFGPDVPVEIVWVGPYAYRSELVHQMRVGRVFLMGDAAKVVSPFGARGGNTGISDADNLGWKLAAVQRRIAPDVLLDSYHPERHAAATENVRVTNRTARFLRPADGIERVFRTAAIDLARRHPFGRSLVNTGRMAVANRYPGSSVCGAVGGVNVQNVPLHWANGQGGELNDLLRWAQGDLLLLVFGPLGRAAAQRLRALSQSAALRSVQVVRAASDATALECVVDAQGRLTQACSLPAASAQGHPAWALLRPDGYLADCGAGIDSRLVDAAARALGMPMSVSLAAQAA